MGEVKNRSTRNKRSLFRVDQIEREEQGEAVRGPPFDAPTTEDGRGCVMPINENLEAIS